MFKKQMFTLPLIVLLLVLSACSAQPTPQPMTDKGTTDTMTTPTVIMTTPTVMMEQPMATMANDQDMMDKPADTMEKATDTMMEETPHSEMMETPTDDKMMQTESQEMDTTAEAQGMMSGPAWFDATLTDVNSGKTFKINDFKGKVVLLETMATWCPNCLQQQQQVKAYLQGMMADDHLVVIGLDIDLNEDAALLKTYTTKNGFDWFYAVVNAETAAEIGKLYGAQFLNPSSTPMLIIDTHGEAHPLPFGIKSKDDLTSALQTYLGM